MSKICNHPVGKYLIDTRYKSLMREFRFYGIEELFTSRENELDVNAMSKNVKYRLKSMFVGDEPLCKPNECLDVQNCGASTQWTCPNYEKIVRERIACYYTFMDVIKAMGGAISGSSVLSAVLKTDWKIKDIDVYVTESNLLDYVLSNLHQIDLPHLYSKSLKKLGMSDELPILRSFSRLTSSQAGRIIGSLNPESYMQKTYGNKFFETSKLEVKDEIENRFARDLQLELVQALKFFFQAETIEIVSKDDLDGAYSSHNGIKYVLRIIIGKNVNPGLVIDFIVTRCTIPFVLDVFDFDFNKIYYDGHSVNCLDWKAVVSKYSSNYKDIGMIKEVGRWDLTYGIHTYVNNIARIRKYFDRGFIVTIKSLYPKYI